MNVYDFDETIFTGDSEDRFFEFMFQKKGYRRYKINFKIFDCLYKAHIITKTKAREHQYSFLKKIDSEGKLDEYLKAYWDHVMQYMKPWYNDVKKADDIIASGTPRFLLVPAMERLGLTNLVATEMDCRTGKIDGYFAVGQYKIVNFKNQFGVDCIDNFYSDAYSDHYVADYAKHAYVLHDDDQITEWNEFFEAHPDKKKER